MRVHTCDQAFLHYNTNVRDMKSSFNNGTNYDIMVALLSQYGQSCIAKSGESEFLEFMQRFHPNAKPRDIQALVNLIFRLRCSVCDIMYPAEQCTAIDYSKVEHYPDDSDRNARVAAFKALINY